MADKKTGEKPRLSKLTPEEEYVIVRKGTEAPFSGEYDEKFEPGIYACRRCNAPLYRSTSKFKSGCGWPSFDDEIKDAVKRLPDPDGMRTEIQCAHCGAHLGHVFTGEHLTEKNTRHCVNSLSLKFIPGKAAPKKAGKIKDDYVVLGGGCFWCGEAIFSRVKGVLKVTPGYSGGTVANPAYAQVCAGTTGHAEVAKVEFDPKVASFERILDVYFAAHDPTSLNRQGSDAGSQYRSVIFCTTAEQKKQAEKFIKKIQARYGKPIVTEVAMLEKFYPAEGYHLDFYRKNPLHPYCIFVIRPKLAKLKEKLQEKLQEK